MNIEEFFSEQNLASVSDSERKFIQEQIKFIKEDPTPFVYGGLKAGIDYAQNKREFLTGILIGFAASDDRVKPRVQRSFY